MTLQNAEFVSCSVFLVPCVLFKIEIQSYSCVPNLYFSQNKQKKGPCSWLVLLICHHSIINEFAIVHFVSELEAQSAARTERIMGAGLK